MYTKIILLGVIKSFDFVLVKLFIEPNEILLGEGKEQRAASVSIN